MRSAPHVRFDRALLFILLAACADAQSTAGDDSDIAL